MPTAQESSLIPAVISPIPTIPPTPNTDALKAGGSSFADPNGAYVFLYPNDYKLDTENGGQHVRITKTGATQKGQTELYDGVLMVFETVDLQGKKLKEWVDTRITESTADGTLTLIQPKKAITLNNYTGFTYTTRGLGEATYTILQKDSTSRVALNIATLVTGPEEKKYQEEVNSILSAIQLLK